MNLGLDISLFTLVLINTCLHITGFGILMYFYHKKRLRTSQMIYFINLSLAEMLLNILEVSQRVPEMLSHTNKLRIHFLYLQHYSILINLTGVWVVLYLTMIYITIDRYCMVRYNFKYQVYWTKYKALCLVAATWFLSGLFTTSIAISEVYLHFPYQEFFFQYFYPLIDFFYIGLVISAYAFIFYRYQKSYKLQHKFSRRSIRRARASSTQQAFNESKFYTSILLVLTFLIFIVVPDLTYMFFCAIHSVQRHTVKHENETSLLFDICRFSYAIASTIDFFLYVFPQQAVRVLVRRKSEQLKEFVGFKRDTQNMAENGQFGYTVKYNMGVKRKITQV